MEVYKAIATRRSVRSYLGKPVPRRTILRLVDAARLAPSASNRQEWRFLVVEDRKKIEELAEKAKCNSFVAKAPVIIACCAKPDGHIMKCGLRSYPIDVAIAIDHITLAAVSEGLGTCWIGSFEERIARRLLCIPAPMRIVQLLALGYPQENSKKAERIRLRLEEILRFDRWTESPLESTRKLQTLI